MNNKWILLVMILLLLLFSGCSNKENEVAEFDNLLIYGDITENVDFKILLETMENKIIEVNGSNEKGYSLDEIIKSLSLIYLDNDIYLIAFDGFADKVDQESIEDTFLYYDEINKWCYYSEKHPVNSKIKNIAKIIIANNTDEINYEYGFNIIENNETIHYDISELLLNRSSIFYQLDGKTKKNGVELGVMKKKEIVSFNDLKLDDEIKLLMMSTKGNHEYIKSEDGYLEIDGSTVNYVDKKSKKTINQVRGVMVDYPSGSVMDVYDDTYYYLDKDVPVMVLFIDGISYFQYEIIANKYPDLVISNLENVNKATSVFKPVTNAGFAAMITGEIPIENGILNRSYRDVLKPTIFDLTKESILVEGNIKILDLSVETVLNFDKNENGYTDDEIFNSAVKQLDESNDIELILVHFHGFDDNGHKYGATDSRTIDYIKSIDKYIETLSSKWDGKIIMTADHGMHDVLDKGNHGEFRAEDLFIPYVIYNGGSYE
jgi:hypothetical protein